MEQSFETMLKELENVVKQLENKEISLDEAVKQYQKGIVLAKSCYDLLQQAEQVLVKVSERDQSETGS